MSRLFMWGARVWIKAAMARQEARLATEKKKNERRSEIAGAAGDFMAGGYEVSDAAGDFTARRHELSGAVGDFMQWCREVSDATG
jgi:hypothetical protein